MPESEAFFFASRATARRAAADQVAATPPPTQKRSNRRWDEQEPRGRNGPAARCLHGVLHQALRLAFSRTS
jgi:hypothetical protein